METVTLALLARELLLGRREKEKKYKEWTQMLKGQSSAHYESAVLVQ